MDEQLEKEQESIRVLEDALGILDDEPDSEGVTGNTLIEQLESSEEVLHENLAKINKDVIQIKAGEVDEAQLEHETLNLGCV